jgi:hypothetical protein
MNVTETKEERIERLRRCVAWHRRRADEMEQELRKETSDGSEKANYTRG